MVTGVVNPTSGSFQWFGEPNSHHQRKRIGTILETPIFYPYLSGRKNLELIARIKVADPLRIDPVLDRVDLLSRADDKFKTYSLGMKQRLAIAGALLGDPDVLIFDEPTNGLDPEGIAQMRTLISGIAETGKTIILASHLLDEVQKICTHFGVLRKGELLHSGPIDEVMGSKAMIEVWSDDPGLEAALKSFKNGIRIEVQNDRFILHVDKVGESAALNKYLFEKGITASLLVPTKKSLEKQFIEILDQAGR